MNWVSRRRRALRALRPTQWTSMCSSARTASRAACGCRSASCRGDTMRINTHLTLLIAGAALIAPSGAAAQGGGRGTAVFHLGKAEILNVEPMENVTSIANAPFTADATTEFTQVLQDGNRIEQRFTTSLARDGRGRTRSEQDVAMLGPL